MLTFMIHWVFPSVFSQAPCLNQPRYSEAGKTKQQADILEVVGEDQGFSSDHGDITTPRRERSKVFTPPKAKMTDENPPFEDVLKMGMFQCHLSLQGCKWPVPQAWWITGLHWTRIVLRF